MTEPTDIDDMTEYTPEKVAEVIAEWNKGCIQGLHPWRNGQALADALESTAAELRQERELSTERGSLLDSAYYITQEVKADLARAREVIEKVRKSIRDFSMTGSDCAVQIEFDLDAYDKAKES